MTAGRAEMLVDLERWDEALEVLAPLLADPDAGVWEWGLLVRIRLGQLDLRGARKAAEGAIAADPASEVGHSLLALVLSITGWPKRAVREARLALELAPDSMASLLGLVVVLSQPLVGKFDDAESVVEDLLRLYPDDVDCWRAAGRVAIGRCEWAEAEARIRRGLVMDPNDADLLALLSRVLDRQGRRRDATDVAVAAVRADPGDDEARKALRRQVGVPVGTSGVIAFVALLAGTAGLSPVLWIVVREPGLAGDVVVVGFLLAEVWAGTYLGMKLSEHGRALARMDPDVRRFTRRARRANSRLRLLAICGSAAVCALAFLDIDWRIGAAGLVAVTAAVVAVLRWTRPRGV